MSERRAVLCCALLSLTLVLSPASKFVRAAEPSRDASMSDAPSAAALAGLGWTSASPLAAAPRVTATAEAVAPAIGEAAPTAAEPMPEPAEADASADPPAEEPPEPTATAETAPRQGSLLADNQVIVFYGTPLSTEMGILGTFPADEAAQRVRQEAAYYDGLNGERGAVPAFDLIYATAQAEQTGNGLFLRYLTSDVVRGYLNVAEQNDVQLILDLQIGRGDVLAEVKKIERYLINPRVHVAIDPEYAVGPDGVPALTPGTITGHEINDVQAYLARLANDHGLPPKMLIVHQYLEDTIVNGEDVRFLPNVDLVINMDGFGEASEKVQKYEHFAKRSYSEHKGFNVFLDHDHQPMSEEDVLRLRPFPDIVFYQ